jgi:hypothetical protein
LGSKYVCFHKKMSRHNSFSGKGRGKQMHYGADSKWRKFSISFMQTPISLMIMTDLF